MCLEVKRDYQKFSWLNSFFRAVYVQGHETNLGFWGASRYPRKIFLGPSSGSGGMVSGKSLKMKPYGLAKNAFPAYSRALK